MQSFLIIVACLVAQPDRCERIDPGLEAMSPMVCMIAGQQIAAAWQAEHPRYTVNRWSCATSREKNT